MPVSWAFQVPIILLRGIVTNMKITKTYLNMSYSKIRKLLTLIGFVCMTVPLIIFGYWLNACSYDLPQPETVKLFNSYFPTYLQGRFDTTLLSVAFCILAILASSFGLKLKGRTWRIVNVIVVIISIIFLCWNLFSMM